MKKIALTFFLSIFNYCFAGVTLQADDAPTDKPWEAPATISWVRNGDGTSNGTVDAVLKYSDSPGAKRAEYGSHIDAMQAKYGLGAFVHRDTSNAAPRNDRGLFLSYGGDYWFAIDSAGPNAALGWMAKITYGTTLQQITDASGVTSNVDRTKDREMLLASGYYQFPVSGTPISNPRPFITFITGRTGIYSDHSSGGNGLGNGRLSGLLADVTINIAPLGLNPDANKLGSLGMIPTLQLGAQTEHDSSSSGSRQQQTYTLYTLGLSLSFAKFDKKSGGIIPSLNLKRTVGADLLTGRPYQTKTELSFGLTF